MRYMLDTDISIYLIKNHPPALRERFDNLRGELCISVIALGELRFGAEKSARRMQNIAAAESYAKQLQVMPFTANAATRFGELRAHLARAGTPVGPFDLLIGAHARSEGLILVTNNIREFARMPGLQVGTGSARDSQRYRTPIRQRCSPECPSVDAIPYCGKPFSGDYTG